MVMEKGHLITNSLKQKLNISSSTEAEVVGTYDFMSLTFWTNYFLEAQGCMTQDMIIYQDNIFIILFREKWQDKQYQVYEAHAYSLFLYYQLIPEGGFHFQYCPTNDMIADFFTKPLHGKKFKEFRDVFLGLE